MNKEKYIQQFLNAPVQVKDDLILERCRGKEVLDVGCVGQDKFFESETWVHGKIKKVAKTLTGVDINLEPREQLKALGYVLYSPDELKASGMKFDVINIGDVIEHVDNVNEFLRFYLALLKPGGELIFTTPNPFSIRFHFAVFYFKYPRINPEHTASLDPVTFLEVVRRLDVEIRYFTWLKEYSRPTGIINRVFWPWYKIMYSFRRFYAPNFMFVLCNK